MGNLSRPINKYLLNAVASGTTDVAAPQDPKSLRYVFIHKALGIAIPGNLADETPIMEVNIKPGIVGTKKVSTLELVKLFNPNVAEYDFLFNIVKKAKWNGFSNEVWDNKHTYNYLKKNFVTASAGEFVAADVTDILTTLAARINADKQLNALAVNTGAAVVASVVPEVVEVDEVKGEHTITVSVIASNTDKMTIGGVQFEFVTTPATGKATIGASIAASLTSLAPLVAANATLGAVFTVAAVDDTLVLTQKVGGTGAIPTLAVTGDLVAAIETTEVGVAAVAPIPAYIKLESKDPDIDFDIEVEGDYFVKDSIVGVPVSAIPSRGKWDDIARIFPVKADDALTIPQTAVVGTYYTEIEITQKSDGYDNVVASGFNTREQKYKIYVPNADADAKNDPIVAQLIIAALAVKKDGVTW